MSIIQGDNFLQSVEDNLFRKTVIMHQTESMLFPNVITEVKTLEKSTINTFKACFNTEKAEGKIPLYFIIADNTALLGHIYLHEVERIQGLLKTEFIYQKSPNEQELVDIDFYVKNSKIEWQ